MNLRVCFQFVWLLSFAFLQTSQEDELRISSFDIHILG